MWQFNQGLSLENFTFINKNPAQNAELSAPDFDQNFLEKLLSTRVCLNTRHFANCINFEVLKSCYLLAKCAPK